MLPTHIGAERMAAMILYPATDGVVAGSDQLRDMKRGLHEFGLEMEVVQVPEDSGMIGETVRDAEDRGHSAFFIVQIDRTGKPPIMHPGENVRIEADDSLILVVRGSRVSAGAIFSKPKKPIKVGRTYY